MTTAEVVHVLQERLEAGMSSVATAHQVALLDFPDHNNSGDSAIWLGEVAFLRRHGVHVAYTCDTSSYDARDLERAHADGALLLHGGGDLGDLRPEHQRLRERVLEDFPSRDVVQLPQTLHVREPGVLDDLMALVFRRSGSYEVHVRDAWSLRALTSRGFDARLTPDMALALGRLTPRGSPAHDVVVVRRADKERTPEALVLPQGLHVLETHWLDTRDRPVLRRLAVRGRRAARALARSATGQDHLSRTLRQLALVASERLAHARVEAALRTLSSGVVVVTDRLHGHTLSLLLGKPHVLLDDAHGRVRRFHEAFTYEEASTWLVDDGREVGAVVRRLLREASR